MVIYLVELKNKSDTLNEAVENVPSASKSGKWLDLVGEFAEAEIFSAEPDMDFDSEKEVNNVYYGLRNAVSQKGLKSEIGIKSSNKSEPENASIQLVNLEKFKNSILEQFEGEDSQIEGISSILDCNEDEDEVKEAIEGLRAKDLGKATKIISLLED